MLHSKQNVGEQIHQTLLIFKRNYINILNGIFSNYSDDCLEGVNCKIKQIERTTYGHSNFKHLVIRIKFDQRKRIKQLIRLKLTPKVDHKSNLSVLL